MAYDHISFKLRSKLREPPACIDAYVQPFQTRGSVFLVTANGTTAASATANVLRPVGSDGEWVCGAGTTLDSNSCQFSDTLKRIRSGEYPWEPSSGDAVSYCLSERVPERCKVQSNAYIAIIVLIITLIKATVMFYLAWRVSETPLLTIGDAIASHTRRPDDSTKWMCLASKEDIADCYGRWLREPKLYEPSRPRLLFVASKLRWFVCIILYVLILGIAMLFLALGIARIATTSVGFQSIWDLGIGKVNPVTVLSLHTPKTGTSGLVANSVVANFAQPILSLMYFLYNGIITTFCTAMEWESYAQHRKGLRVSGKAQGDQRSTYFLQLPYRFSLPLMTLSGLLHWLGSQSLFLVIIDTWAYSTRAGEWTLSESDTSSRMSCGYSPMAIIFLLVTGYTMLGLLVGSSFRKLRTGMPVVASCSAAIAAACHLPDGEHDGDASVAKLQWGETQDKLHGVRHVAFSHLPVEAPEERAFYI
ncbi:hypothetical protein EJ04DRAFT_554087 [Polyplosphaeria fusca]|uniref:Uncharacterized protein n=1 Tax=Polyplosphaeria fusca TaxID=682080 RepID=A0A9P4QWA4_9PLEO|nr:hypothetical protein EJ04DRAFT_554087 [Polyplosphaeria fusca]